LQEREISLKPVSGDEVDFRRAKLQLNLRQVFDPHFGNSEFV